MPGARRIFAGALLAILVAGAGIGAGYYFHLKQSESPAVQATEEKPALNLNTYDVSPPSRATTLATKDIPISPMNNMAEATLSVEDASDIKTGQRVLFHDAEDKLVETLGEVVAVQTGDGVPAGMAEIKLRLNTDRTALSRGIRKAKIITARRPDTPRLPLSALVRNDQGEDYIWEAAPNRDGTTTAYFKRASLLFKTDSYVALSLNSTSGNSFILNPDNNLRDGQTINVRKTLYAAPPEPTEDGLMSRTEERRNKSAIGRTQWSNGPYTCAPVVPGNSKLIDKLKNAGP